jgi:UPF0755 protein
MSAPSDQTKMRRLSESLAWRIFRPVIIFLLSLGLVALLVWGGWSFVENRFILPVAAGDKTAYSVEIKRGSSTQTIAKQLEDAGIVRSAAAFKLYVDVFDQGASIKAGVYQFNKSMSLDEIVNMLKKGQSASNVVVITITEGMNIEDIANVLLKKNLLKDKNKFFELCRTGSGFTDYDFISSLNGADDARRTYKLEGYLFPDTYEVYTDSTEEMIIKKMLNRFSDIFSDTYIARMQALSMTIDQVISLASMIEKEGKTDDFKKISAVFHLRIEKHMNLGSDATIRYFTGATHYLITTKERDTDSLYNTYKYPGYPLGPICNPGKLAIEAALYPDEDFMKQGYLYFSAAEPVSGKLVFAKTLPEHQKQVDQYRPLWEQYDAAH